MDTHDTALALPRNFDQRCPRTFEQCHPRAGRAALHRNPVARSCALLAAAARSRVRPRLRAGADAEDIVDAGLRRQHRAHARRADVRSDVQAHRACPMPWLPLCLLRWRRRQAAVRAAAKRARGCNSAKRSHLRAATVASRTAAARCVRSARSASPSARAASALRLSTPDGCFPVDRMTATRQA